jgi:hypothetical protein
MNETVQLVDDEIGPGFWWDEDGQEVYPAQLAIDGNNGECIAFGQIFDTERNPIPDMYFLIVDEPDKEPFMLRATSIVFERIVSMISQGLNESL